MKTKTKIALITGGSRGLGKNMALQLAKKGLDVIITYNSNKTEADKVVAEIEELGNKAYALQLDVSEYNHYEPFFKEHLEQALQSKFENTKIDYLINNAGFGIYKPFA